MHKLHVTYDHIFDELEIRTDPFAICELQGACSLGLGREQTATLHYILCGEGEISFRNGNAVKIMHGSLVLIPAQQSHILRSFGRIVDPIPACKPAELNLANHLKSSETDASGRLIALCTHVTIGLRGAIDAIDLVREPMLENYAPDSRIGWQLNQLLLEVSMPGLGSRAMIRVILLQCIIDMLRLRLISQDQSLAWMAALKDQKVWVALQHMLDEPGHPHTVDSLAEEVGMSRSAFSKRFTDAYGSGPMHLLRDIRMRMAGSLLLESELPVKRIAELVGFKSRSAFSRMFERNTGKSPKRFRSTDRDGNFRPD